ncbi:MAG TPA: cupin domain-containing protein [Thermomicrobiales bacterium]|nr:cupin domain-containing protein [Thermomicrobiales bacterium]
MSAEDFQTIRATEVRKTVTPNAVMTTLASPTLSGTTHHCLWQVEFEPRASGPHHSMDSEQIWYLESGLVRCEIGEEEVLLGPGDVIRLAGGVVRRFHAVEASTFIVCGEPGARAATPTTTDGVIPAWIA